MSSRHLENFFSVTIFCLPRRLQSIFKTSLKLLARCLQDVLQDVFKKSSRHLQDNLEDKKLLRWRCVEDAFKTCLKDVFKTSSKHLQDVFKTSCKMYSRHLQDIFKTTCKTKNCYAEDVLKASSRHVLKVSSRRLKDQQMFAGSLPFVDSFNLFLYLFLSERKSSSAPSLIMISMLSLFESLHVLNHYHY